MQLATRRPAIRKTVSKLELMSKSDSFRFEYENRIKALRDQRARERTAARIGREEGIREGIAQGREEILNLLRRGSTQEEILYRN